MKILLIRPKPSKKSLGLHNLMICEPLELEYVSAFLKQLGHEVYLKDMILEDKELEYFLHELNPEMIGFTSYITHVNVVKDYARTVKSIDKKIITFVGGVHSEVMPDDYEDENIDYILGRNGLKNLGLLCKAIATKQVPEFQNRPIDASFILPLPDRKISNKYRSKYDYAFHAPCALLKTSYGCPYNCKFCFCVEITDHNYFERKLEDVIYELKTIKERNVFIVDDNFLVSLERVNDFCDLLIENQIDKKYIIFGRADFILKNETVLKKFKKCGLDAVFVGIESFKQDELNDFNKKTNIETNEAAINILNSNGIDCYAGIIVGPNWTVKDFNNFSKWMVKMNVMFANIQPLVPLPGTEIFNKYKDQLLFGRDEFEKWDLAHIVIKPTKMSVSRYYFEIMRAYFHSTLSFRTYLYIRKKYGKRLANKSSLGALFILWQYVILMLKSFYEKNSSDTANHL